VREERRAASHTPAHGPRQAAPLAQAVGEKPMCIQKLQTADNRKRMTDSLRSVFCRPLFPLNVPKSDADVGGFEIVHFRATIYGGGDFGIFELVHFRR
jgi:hypothetical protein